MSERRRRRSPPTWVAVLGGLALGFVTAVAAWGAFNLLGKHAREAPPVVAAPARVAIFRLPAGSDREMVLVPAGPDAAGEPALAGAMFAGDAAPQELVSMWLANVSPDRPWDVDLAREPLSCRTAADAPWRTLDGLSRFLPGGADAARLSPAQSLRLRGLGAGPTRVTVAPKSLRQVLLALPPHCRLDGVEGVQWGTSTLLSDRWDVEALRRFREDPAAVTAGR